MRASDQRDRPARERDHVLETDLVERSVAGPEATQRVPRRDRPRRLGCRRSESRCVRSGIDDSLNRANRVPKAHSSCARRHVSHRGQHAATASHACSKIAAYKLARSDSTDTGLAAVKTAGLDCSLSASNLGKS